MIDFDWEWDPFVVTPLIVSLFLYGIGLRRLWRRAGLGRGVASWQAAAFLAGWLTLAAALVSPLHEYGEHLFLAHMIEHELLMAVAAPLLAVSRPLGTFLHALPRPPRLAMIAGAHKRPMRWLWQRVTAPAMATLLHAIAIWAWHIPVLLEGTLHSELLHRLQHICFLVTALFFWWAILRRPRRDYGVGAAHVFITMVHTGLLGALLTISPRVFYPLQAHDAPLFGLTPLEDQQLAGLFMWVPGGGVYLGCGLALLYAWLRREDRSRTGAFLRYQSTPAPLPNGASSLRYSTSGHAVAVTRQIFQGGTVSNDDAAAQALDQPGTFQYVQADGDAAAFGGDHHGHEFVRQMYFVTLGAVVAHQQPPGQSRFHAVKGIGGNALSGLHQQGLDIAQHCCSKAFTLTQGFQVWCGFYAQRRTIAHLHESLLWRLRRSQHQGRRRYALKSENADLAWAFAHHLGDGGSDATLQE